jgi:hypothetical protein
MAFNKWPIILPKQMNSPFLVYTGTNDGNVVTQLRKQENDIGNAKGKLVIFDEIGHWGLTYNLDKVEYMVMEFLRKNK